MKMWRKEQIKCQFHYWDTVSIEYNNSLRFLTGSSRYDNYWKNRNLHNLLSQHQPTGEFFIYKMNMFEYWNAAHNKSSLQIHYKVIIKTKLEDSVQFPSVWR